MKKQVTFIKGPKNFKLYFTKVAESLNVLNILKMLQGHKASNFA